MRMRQRDRLARRRQGLCVTPGVEAQARAVGLMVVVLPVVRARLEDPEEEQEPMRGRTQAVRAVEECFPFGSCQFSAVLLASEVAGRVQARRQ